MATKKRGNLFGNKWRPSHPITFEAEEIVAAISEVAPETAPEPIGDDDCDTLAEVLGSHALAQFLPAVPEPVPQLPPPPAGLTPRQVAHVRELLAETERRRLEALKLYEPMPSQSKFHLSMSRSRIARGSNRSGKTTSTMVEIAWAATGQHPQKGKYPERDIRICIVAKDLDKISKVVWAKLGRAGAFQMVKDPETNDWRAWRPGDDEKGLKKKPAPPLLPPRFIEDIVWESRKANIPKTVITKTGGEISFYSSKSDPFSIQGSAFHIIVFDEEIVHASWYPEAMARLVDFEGWFMWGATPQTGTQQLYDLHLRAEEAEEAGEETPAVTEVFMSIFDNPHLSAKAKQDFLESIDEEEARVRVHGEFAITGTKVYEGYFYPNGLHGVDAFPIPPSWTRLLAIDPGSQVCAVLFAACPPLKPDISGLGLDPSPFGDFVYFYDELYIKNCDAHRFAERMKGAIGDQEFKSFLIDVHGGKLREIGSGKRPEQQYRDALRELKVKCLDTGHGFTYASDDIDAGILRVKEFLRVRDDGTSRFRVLKGRCPKLCWEAARYQWKVVNGMVTEKPLQRHSHLMDCWRYLAQFRGLKYYKSKSPAVRIGGAYGAFKQLQEDEKRRLRREVGSGVTLG